jgi:ParB/RepB/Spo0J family partition protein
VGFGGNKMIKNEEGKQNKTQKEADEIENIVKIPIDKIIPNWEQSRTRTTDDMQKLASSMKKIGQINPVEVTPRQDKYMLCGGGQGRTEAAKSIGWKHIKAVIRNYNDDEAAERALAENISRTDLTSIQRENAINKRWITKKYKTYRELGEAIGLSGERVGQIIDAKVIRDRTNGPLVSTQVIIDSKPLKSDIARKKLFEMVYERKIDANQVNEAAYCLQDWPIAVRNAIFKGYTSFSNAKSIIDRRIPLLKNLENELQNKYIKGKIWEKTLKEIDEKDKEELFRKLFKIIKDFEPNFVREIKDPHNRAWIINWIKFSTIILLDFLFKLDEITEDQLEKARTELLKMKLSVEDLKQQGHMFAFEREWDSPEDEELKKEIRRVRSGRKEPLKKIFNDLDDKVIAKKQNLVV